MDRIFSTVKCLSCNVVLQSKHRHDFQICQCENSTFVDGGSDYMRSGGMDLNLIKFISPDDPEYKEACDKS